MRFEHLEIEREKDKKRESESFRVLAEEENTEKREERQVNLIFVYSSLF